MFTRLPDLVDPLFYAEQKRQIKAKVAQAQLPRLVEATTDSSGDVFVEMAFFKQKPTGSPAFDLHIKTKLKLMCQRTLQAFEHPVDISIRGVFLPATQLFEELDAEWEVFNLPEDKMSLIPIIEDEILLAIPLAPKAEGDAPVLSSETQSAGVESLEEQANPFLVLAKLKSESE